MRLLVPLAALALAACACKGKTEAAAPETTSLFISVAGDGEGRRPPEGYTGTWIDIVPGVEYRQSMVMGSNAMATNKAHINGHPFSVDGDFVVIGPKRYGPIAAGAHVEIKNDGVFADGKPLGTLPERVELPAVGK